MMEAGTYWIGDTCYTLHDVWEEVCDLIINEHTVLDGEFTLPGGRRFATYSTKYGDGTYQSSDGQNLSVDSGSIGCIKLEDIDQTDPHNRVDYGTIVEFEHPFDTYEENGVIHIGHISIDTDPPYEEEEEGYYEEEEEEWT